MPAACSAPFRSSGWPGRPRAFPGDSVVELLTDDPAARYDVPAWCRLRGHELVRTEPATDLSPGAPGEGPTGPEPSAPNVDPDDALRHVIRIGGPAHVAWVTTSAEGGHHAHSGRVAPESTGLQASAAGSARRYAARGTSTAPRVAR